MAQAYFVVAVHQLVLALVRPLVLPPVLPLALFLERSLERSPVKGMSPDEGELVMQLALVGLSELVGRLWVRVLPALPAMALKGEGDYHLYRAGHQLFESQG